MNYRYKDSQGQIQNENLQDYATSHGYGDIRDYYTGKASIQDIDTSTEDGQKFVENLQKWLDLLAESDNLQNSLTGAIDKMAEIRT